MTIFQGFSDADAPWIPELIDIEAKKVTDQSGYYSRFGWENLSVPDDCPYVSSRMGHLKIRFDERYANRMLNSETLERWQVRLQNRFDEVVDRYERAYRLYAEHEQEMFDDIIAGEKVVSKSNARAGGTDSVTSEGLSKDSETYDLAMNVNDDYAGRFDRTEGSSTTRYGRTDNVDSTVTRTKTGTEVIDGVNEAIDRWKDIDTQFVAEFENNFLNIWWY